MQYAVVNDLSDSIGTLRPTLILGFFDVGAKSAFEQGLKKAVVLWPEARTAGISTAGNLENTLPYVDTERSHPVIWVLIALRPDSYSLRLIETAPTTFPPPFEGAQPDCAAIVFGADCNDILHAGLELLRTMLGDAAVCGMVAASVNGCEGAQVCLDGVWSSGGYLEWLLDTTHYEVEHASMHEFDPVGMELTVTAAERHHIRTIEDEPALSLVESMVGTITPDCIYAHEHPLFLRSELPSCPGGYNLVSLLRTDHADGTLEVAAKVCEGDMVRVASPASEQQRRRRLRQFYRRFGPREGLLLVPVSYAVSRNLRDHENLRLIEITRRIQQMFAGFHTYGEIGTCNPDCASQVLYQTITAIRIVSKG